MRYLATILLAMLAVACSKADQHETEAAASDAGDHARVALSDAATEIRQGYEKAKPGLEALGDKAEKGLKKAGVAAKREIHEATAPTPQDEAAESE
jgi:hypothetical protein